MPELKQKDWKFIMIVGTKRMTLSDISKETKMELSAIQKIYSKLNKSGLIETFKKGRKRFIQLNENGIYFYKFYQKHENNK